MKILRGVAVLLVFTVVAIVAIAMMSDQRWEVQREITINATGEKIFPYINHLERWSQWTAWNKESYPDMAIEHAGQPQGVGAIQRWHDGDLQGSITITDSQPDESITYHVALEQGTHAMDGRIWMEGKDSVSRVHWQVTGDTGDSILGRVTMLLFKPLIGRDLGKGLYRLKGMLEDGQA